MITILQAIILGLLQGITELFPISSLGHSVVLPSILGWNIHQNDSYFLTFLIATHLATATVLFIFFLRIGRRSLAVSSGHLNKEKLKKMTPMHASDGFWLLERYRQAS